MPATDPPGGRGDPSSSDLPLALHRSGLALEEARRCFVLLHGFGAHSFTWRRWIPVLGKRGHVVAVDLKGFGAAPRPADGAYGPHDQAVLVHRLIRRLGPVPVTLVGHSLGGGVALLTALRVLDERPGTSRLDRLVLLSSAAYHQRLPPFVWLSRRRRLSHVLARTLGPRTIISLALRAIVYDRGCITREMVEGYAAPLASPAAWRAILDAGASVVPPDLDTVTGRYPEIAVPTLLLWGRQDRVVPLHVGRRLAAALPQASLEILDRCGHLPHEEHPADTLQRVLAFLDRTGG